MKDKPQLSRQEAIRCAKWLLVHKSEVSWEKSESEGLRHLGSHDRGLSVEFSQLDWQKYGLTVIQNSYPIFSDSDEKNDGDYDRLHLQASRAYEDQEKRNHRIALEDARRITGRMERKHGEDL